MPSNQLKLGLTGGEETIREARDQYWEALEKGAYCPCCNRWGKMQKRPLNSTMARSLIWLARKSVNRSWVDVPETGPRYVVKTMQICTVAYWGLIESKGTDEDQKYSGIWRPTQKGIDFVMRRITVPKYGYFFDRRAWKFEGPEITIEDALTSHFSYSELMGL